MTVKNGYIPAESIALGMASRRGVREASTASYFMSSA